MDNTIDKDDDGKPYASWSSAMFVKYILENDIIQKRQQVTMYKNNSGFMAKAKVRKFKKGLY